MDIKRVGTDLEKQIFQVHGAHGQGNRTAFS